MSVLPNTQKMQIFESAAKQEEDPIGDIPVRIEIDARSISSFLKTQPDALEKMWDKAQHLNSNEDNLLRGDQLNDFLHDILKKWYEFYRPREEAKLVKAQTRAAVGEFKQLISSSCGESDMIELDKWVLSKDNLLQFIEEMKQKKFQHEDVSITKAFETLKGKVFDPTDSGSAIPSKNGVDVLYRNYKNHLMETPIQKYCRLKNEVIKFHESLSKLSGQKSKLKSISDVDPVSKAKNDLGELSELLVGKPTEIPEDNEQYSFAASDLLFSNVNSYLEGTSTQGKREPSDFVLYSKGSFDEEQTAELNKLANRLENLEKISGASNEAIYTKDAMTLIHFLSKHLNWVADLAKIKDLQDQVNWLINEVDQSKAKTQMSLEVEQSTKSKTQMLSKRLKPSDRWRIAQVEMMFEAKSTWDKAAEQLPMAIDRLKNLQQLNMEASGVVQQVNELGARQTNLSETLAEDQQLLKSMYKRLVSNTENIRANVKSLDERISALLC